MPPSSISLEVYYCIYCKNNLSVSYYIDHIKTRKHIKNKHHSIDKHLLSIPKEISDIIVKYYDNPEDDLRKFKCRNMIRNKPHKKIYFKSIPWYKRLIDRIYEYF